jgi:hypothetical protein
MNMPDVASVFDFSGLAEAFGMAYTTSRGERYQRHCQLKHYHRQIARRRAANRRARRQRRINRDR